MSSNQYPPAQAKLFACMTERSGDIPIAEIFMCLKGHRLTSNRRMQQYVGSHISKLNNLMENYRVVPGDTKRTYKLVKKV